MFELEIPKFIREIAERGHVNAGDVIALRRSIYPRGVVSERDADALFWLNEACDGCRQWHEFFVEALTDFYLDHQMPTGYVDEKGCDHLSARILRNGRVSTPAELELLVTLIEKAFSVPERMILFVLAEIRVSVLEGDGPMRRGQFIAPGVIAAGEVDLLRRVVYGMGSGGNMHVTRLEAELLFDLNDAIVGSAYHDAWSDLFVKAVANYVMAANLWAPPSRDEAAKHNAWLEKREGTLGFMRRMAEGGVSGALDALKLDAEREAAERRAARESAIADAEIITGEEASWLARRLGRDGVLHDNERALLDFLKARAPRIHPTLRSVIDRAA